MTARARIGERGSILTWVMVIGLFTVGALGAATRLIPAATHFTVQDSDATYAFIAAESGMHYVAHQIQTGGVEALIGGEINVTLGGIGADAPEKDQRFRVFVDDEDDGYIYLVGQFGGVTRTLRAKKVLTQRGAPATPRSDDIRIDVAVYALGEPGARYPAVDLSGGGQVHGDAGTNATASGSVTLRGGAAIYGNILIGSPELENPGSVVSKPDWIHVSGVTKVIERREFPLPVFPEPFEGLPDRGSVRTAWDNPLVVISEPGHYDSIFVGQGPYKVVFNTAGKDLYIRANKLEVTGDGSVEVTGGGRLHLYVDSILTLADKRFNMADGDTMSTVIYYAGSSPVTLASGFNFKGIIYVKNADVTVAGSFGPDLRLFTGGAKVTLAGGAILGTDGLIYAPRAHVVVGGGAQTGVVIANSVQVAGGARINHNVQLIPQFPLEFSLGEQQEEDEVEVELLQWELCWRDCLPPEFASALGKNGA